ncbi:MAG: amidohydrolase family protein, partial [Dokdonella sp.]
HNLLEELRFARAYDDAHWGSVLSDFDLVQMVTTNAAHAIALDATLGSIAVGKKADLNVISANTCGAPWSALVRARARDVRLVMVGGVPLYGDTSMQAAAPSVPGCEALDVCGVSKFVCVAESGGTVANKLGQTLADITGVLTQALTDYDALNLTQWKFSPITPLVDCP